MVDKLLTLQLGGQERTLLYGTMGYFTYIKEATGKEPFDFLRDFDEKRESSIDGSTITVMIEDIAVLVYAGLNSFLDSQDKENIPLGKVKKWCNALAVKTITEICASAFGSISEPGEPQPQAANGVQA